MANVDPSLCEAAQNLGAGGWRLFRSVTLPLILPGWFAGAIIVFIAAFTDLGTPMIFGFGRVVPMQIFDAVNDLNTNPQGYALVILVLGVLIAWLLTRRRLPFAAVLDALSMLPLALPGLVQAFGYVAGFDFDPKRSPWLGTWFNPRENPTVLLIVSYSVQRLP